MNTNYNNDVAGALRLITINGSKYQLGKDASNTEGGISKLFSAFETYKASTDGAYNAKVVYDEIANLKTLVGADGENSIADRVSDIEEALGNGFDENNTVADGVAAAKSTIALANGESYLSLSSNTDATDGHTAYTISTTGIDNAISSAISEFATKVTDNNVVDTFKEIVDWIASDTSGAAKILSDIADLDSNKADKVENATNGNFAGLDANGNLTDSGKKAADFATAAQGALADTAVQDASYVHTDNNYTTAEKNKLAAIDASVSGDVLTITTQAA